MNVVVVPRFSRLVSAGTLLAMAALGLPALSHGATIPVGVTNDLAASPGCTLREAVSAANANNAGFGGDCTPGDGTDDVITLGANTYDLAIANASPFVQEDSNVSGDLDITESVTIRGAGMGATTVDANLIDRVFQILAGQTVTIENLTITGGEAIEGVAGSTGPDAGASGDPSNGGPGLLGAHGGGVLNNGTLTLESVDVRANRAGEGGDGGDGGQGGDGVSGQTGGDSTGGEAGEGGSGGGVANFGPSLIVVDSRIQDNFAGFGGNGGSGGAAGDGGPSALTGSPGGASTGGDSGKGGSGGGIHSALGTTEVIRTMINDNFAGDSGFGGLGGPGGAGGTGGNAGGDGGKSQGGDGPFFNGVGGGVSIVSGGLTITDSTITSNDGGEGRRGGNGGPGGNGGAAPTQGAGGNSVGGGGGLGGGRAGIDHFTGQLEITGTTISGNNAGRGGDGGNGTTGGSGAPVGTSDGGNAGSGGFTGGLGHSGSGSLTLTNSTVFSNRGGTGGDGGNGTSTGGDGRNGGGNAGVSIGVANAAITHATVTSNQPGLGGTAGTGGTTNGTNGNVGQVGGVQGTNLTTVLNTIVASNGGAQCEGSMVGVDGNNLSFPDSPVTCPASEHGNPLLAGLADNGGPTFTHALGAGSPAIDAVPLAAPHCAGVTDQRGITRPKGALCDIGAVERSLPAASTGAATNITFASSRLTGTVNPSQFSTTYRFQFGTTTAYGSQTPTIAAGAGSTSVAAAATAVGLAPGTLYHYRLVATNRDGTSTGADRTFLSAPGPFKPPSPFTGVTLLTKSARADSRGRVTVRVRCPAAAVGSCEGTLVLKGKVKAKSKAKKSQKAKTVTLGRARFSIDPGKTKRVTIRLSKTRRGQLRAAKTLKGSLTASATDGRGGRAKQANGKLTVKAPKRKRRKA